MCRIANTKQPFPIPLPQVIQLHRQQLHIIPVRNFARVFRQKRSALPDFLPKHLQPALLSFLERTFADDVNALPIIPAVNQDHELPGANVTKSLRRITICFLNARPQHINGRAQVNHFHTGALAHSRTPAIPTTNSARTSSVPSGVCAFTPTTFPFSSSRSVT